MSDTILAARLIHDYLVETDPLPEEACDAVIGFGVFDLRLPRLCGDLYTQGLARRIVFTGGIGAGTGNLGGPEADVWRAVLAESYPDIPSDDVIVENQSTNTAENVTFTAALLERTSPALAFGQGLRRVLVVASPSRLRRVWLTLAQLQPALAVVRHSPDANFEFERTLYEAQGIDYLAHLAGEIDRIVAYGARGWIADEPLPGAVAAARALLAQGTAP